MTALPYLLAVALLGAWAWDELRIERKLGSHNCEFRTDDKGAMRHAPCNGTTYADK